jgi:hypothetical protein
MTAVAPVQVGIFSNDLCIGYRIIMHELLDSHVFRVFEAAKTIHKKKPKDEFKPMFERGIKSINAWDTQIKEQYRAQVLAQYRQLTDLYHHIYLMYVQEMYDQSMDDVTVRVNIPALSTMLYLFLKLACNHNVILSGEYITTMNFPARVLFVETILRRLLYELLVQQNNIKSISTNAPPRRSTQKTAKNNISVHSDNDIVSADMTMGTQRQAAPRLSPTADADRFWMAPTASPTPSEHSGSAILGPGYKPRESPMNSVVSSMASREQPPSPAPPPPPPPPPAPSQASSANFDTFVSPTLHSGPATTEKDTVLTAPVKEAALIASSVPRITSLPQPPTISASIAAGGEQKSALFVLRSEFNGPFTSSPFKPAGTAFPDPKIDSNNRQDIEVDSLELQPSNQSFTAEARKLLEGENSATITPFDSVTNIAANPDQRPPLFFDTLRPC